jgi:hypothetical protein
MSAVRRLQGPATQLHSSTPGTTNTRHAPSGPIVDASWFTTDLRMIDDATWPAVPRNFLEPNAISNTAPSFDSPEELMLYCNKY